MDGVGVPGCQWPDNLAGKSSNSKVSSPPQGDTGPLGMRKINNADVKLAALGKTQPAKLGTRAEVPIRDLGLVELERAEGLLCLYLGSADASICT